MMDPGRLVVTERCMGLPAEAAKGDRLQVLYLLAIHTGLKQGELLGLKWGDVDPDRGTLHVQRTLSAAKEGPTFTTPKTTRVAACGSRRTPYKPCAIIVSGRSKRD